MTQQSHAAMALQDGEPERPVVTILIKALNEERRIAACLEHALAAADRIGGEVLLVDSQSEDATVEIAMRYPVRIVQFLERGDRGCGAAVQLGWLHARGRFVYVLDADMLLQPDFLALACQRLQDDSRLAGVGGIVADTRVRTAADARRVALAARQREPQPVNELGGGGLYRRSAIEQVGYLAHRALSANEESELGVRLRAAGWHLLRLPVVAVVHEGHDESNVQMLRRLWRNGRAASAGVFVRSSWGKPWLPHVVRKLWHAFIVPPLHLVAILLAGLAPAGYGLPVWSASWAAIFAIAMLRARDPVQGAWTVVLWHFWFAGLARGLWVKPIDPRTPIPARVLASGPVRS